MNILKRNQKKRKKESDFFKLLPKKMDKLIIVIYTIYNVIIDTSRKIFVRKVSF